MKKIAFLFLILDNPNFPNIWDEYFINNNDKFTLYIHPKFPNKITWHKENVITNLQPTAWGFITRAYIELYKSALLNPDNFKFITISESCLPITSFNKFYDTVINDPNSWIKFMNIKSYDLSVRIHTQKTLPKPPHFIKHYARSCLNRSHVEQLINSDQLGHMEFFHRMHVGDEFFLSLLHPLSNVSDFAVTTDDWNWTHQQQKIIKKKIRNLYEIQEKTSIDKSSDINILKNTFNQISGSPKTIHDTKPDLQSIINSTSFFYRKFASDSNINNFWHYIISKHIIS